MQVIPLSVLLAWFNAKPLDLNMEVFETACLFTTVLTVAMVIQDGESNYLKGMILCFAYVIVAACFFFHQVCFPVLRILVLQVMMMMMKEYISRVVCEQDDLNSSVAAPLPKLARLHRHSF